MPIIQFTQADRLAAVRAEPGWYPVTIVNVSDATPSSSKKSISYEVTFQIADGKYKGKEHSIFYNTETNSSSVLGTRQYTPAAEMLHIAAILAGKKFNDVDLTVDTSTWIGSPLDAKFVVEAVEGNLQNKITEFAPAGQGEKGSASPF
jgi:hypothetical protein